MRNHQIGDRVGIPWLHSACGACEHCVNGFETLCPNQLNSGFSINGAMAEYAIGHASHVLPIPEKVSFTDAARKFCRLMDI